VMMNPSERLCENVSKLVLGRNIIESDQAFHELLPTKVTIKLNIFCPFMEDRILSNVDGSLAITLHWDRSNRCDSKFIQQSANPIQPQPFSYFYIQPL